MVTALKAKFFTLCLKILILQQLCGASSPPVQKCTKITHSECQNAGYPNTAPFADIKGKPYQEVKGKELSQYLKLLSSCAKTKSAAAVLCSLYFPRCEEHLTRPLLPCRSVCNDFVHKCADFLHLAAQQGMLSSICDLLPLYDGKPDTCFIPKGFDVSKAAGGLNKTRCHKVGISNCQDDLHYNTTFVPTEAQNKSEANLLQSVIATNCSSNIEKFTCFTRFPPCSEGAVQIPCKSLCTQIKRSCDIQFANFNIPANDCDFLYPDDDGTNGICTLTKWPAPWATSPVPYCSKCTKITIKECADIGYSHTFKFKDIDNVPYQSHVASALGKFLKILTCSKYAKTILCSLYLPKCDPLTCSDYPVLPCRKVCYDFVKKCETSLSVAAIHGLMIGLCDLLRVDSSMTKPCFVPEGFTSSAVYNRRVCYPIDKSNRCQKDFSYNTTFISPKDQAMAQIHLLQPVIDSKCSDKAEKFFCYTRFPPCRLKGQVAVPLPCRSMCKEVLGKCKDVFQKYQLPMADCNFLLPDGEGKDGICQADVFPVAFRHMNRDRTPPGNKKKVNAGLIAGVVVLLLVVIVAIVFGIFYYRRKKLLKPFEPQELHNTEGPKA